MVGGTKSTQSCNPFRILQSGTSEIYGRNQNPSIGKPSTFHILDVDFEIRVLNSTLKGGLWCGWLGAVYFGVQGLSLYARQVRDPWNTVMAAWASGSIFGFARKIFNFNAFREVWDQLVVLEWHEDYRVLHWLCSLLD